MPEPCTRMSPELFRILHPLPSNTAASRNTPHQLSGFFMHHAALGCRGGALAVPCRSGGTPIAHALQKPKESRDGNDVENRLADEVETRPRAAAEETGAHTEQRCGEGSGPVVQSVPLGRGGPATKDSIGECSPCGQSRDSDPPGRILLWMRSELQLHQP